MRAEIGYEEGSGQTALVEVSDDDAAELRTILAAIIAPGIKRLRQINHGFPAELDSAEEWAAILTKIETGFRYIEADDVDDLWD